MFFECNFKFLRKLSAVSYLILASVGFIGFAAIPSASALTMTGTSCLPGSLTLTQSCEGIFSGNDSGNGVDAIHTSDTLFNLTGWHIIEKVDIDDNSDNVDGGLGLAITFDMVGDMTKGGWSVTGYSGYDPVMFILKAGPTYSAFLADLTVLSGDWNTLSNLDGSGAIGPDLSHFSIYSTSVVPIPAALPLFGSGLALLGFMGWRRKRKMAA